MAEATVNENQIMKEIPRIVAWMEALGLPGKKSRYARYEGHVDRFFDLGVDPLSAAGTSYWNDLNNAYRECIDMYLIYNSFKDVEHPNFISTLSKVISGQDVPELSDAGASRNFLFELLVAARFKLAGYSIDFDNSSDVVARRDGILVRTECKRLVSEKQLERRIKKSNKQLESTKGATDEEVIGIVFIDVSSCVVSAARQLVETQEHAGKEIRSLVGDFLTRNEDLVERMNERYVNVSYATCLVGTLPFWCKEFVFHVSSATAVRAAAALSDEKFKNLQHALAGFDETFTKVFESAA